jgi:hypothetical protein
VVPRAGQNAILHGTFVQRETHVGAAVVNGVNLSVVPKDGYGAIWTGYNDDTLMLQLLQRTDIYPHYLSDHCHLQHLPFAPTFVGLAMCTLKLYCIRFQPATWAKSQ